MQVVASNHASPRLATAELEPVRRIATRFPEANLREVAVVRAPDLDARADRSAGTRVWLALEALQTTGSFKVRGALVALDRVRERRGPDAHVVAASAGNHGAGVAYAAGVLGLSATVVLSAR
jgi:threonine dehydratase